MRDAPAHYTDKFHPMLTFEEVEPGKFGGPGSDYRPFVNLTAASLSQIIAEAPHLADQTQNDSPSMTEFLALGQKYPHIRFHGYLIGPERTDERISIEGWHGADTLAICKQEGLTPDEVDDNRAWWD